MSHYIGEYTKTCDLCLRTKVQRQPPIGELHPLQVPEAHWDILSMDFIVELPEVSDRGGQFVCEFTHELYRLLGICIVASTVYHPQTDGQTKHVNQELE